MFLRDILEKRHADEQLDALSALDCAVPASAEGFVRLNMCEANLDIFALAGVRISGLSGSNNIAYLPEDAKYNGFTVNLNNRSNSLVFLGRKCNLTKDSKLSLEGDNHTAIVGGGRGFTKLHLTMRDQGGLFHYGDGNFANQVDVLVHGRVAAAIGSDCMLSWGITMRTYDSHALIEVGTRNQINKAEPVIVESHVWVAQNVTIMPGVTVGRGAVVGAGSIVTKSIPPRTLAVGAPARIIREGVTWAVEPSPNERQIETALQQAGL
jgi:acetyltransferase-like isoleucine patch superfamily enzyme